jgi:hypothetical protein
MLSYCDSAKLTEIALGLQSSILLNFFSDLQANLWIVTWN